MNRRQLLLVAVLSITCCVYAQQEHTVVAMVLGRGAKKIPEIKVNGVKMNLQAPQGNTGAQEPAPLVQGAPSEPATFSIGGKASDVKLAQPAHPPAMAAALVMPAPKKPKTVEEKAMDDLKLTKEEKASLFPCEDYQPYCKNYAATGQCRDVWTQKNCRKSCKLCDIPYGVFIGCQDLDVCKKFAASSCMVRWVRETCKSKCGQCGYQRQAASHITMGKKRHFPDATKKQSDKTKQAVKTKALKKVIKKMTKKAKDTVTQAAAKVKQEKKKVDKPVLTPEVAVDEKPVPKDEDEEVSKEKNDDNDDDDDDDAADEGYDASGQDASGENNSQDEDEDDDDDDDKASGENKTEDKPAAPIRMDTDPRGEPVVAKLVNQPIKFNDAPAKTMHVKLVKEAKPKVEQKKVSSDKVVKKVKQVKKVQNKDKPKKKATKSKKH